ncbi:MAG: type II toxin-antitoxin system Phd/YefM family antitoxin [Verrucomicrobia bacterium]|nr:type II toxin-antitoxin system Phd/YefM family antitoxin [Leptolyngbya sp. ES-bin-22]
MPKQISYAEACDNFEQVYEAALSGQEPIEIVREGSESLSIIPTAALESLMETVYLFQSHENAARLLEALERAKAGQNLPRTVESLRQEFGLAEEKLSA